MVNLDFLCMKTAQEMVGFTSGNEDNTASNKENVATKALGVLIENGPYGLILFLETTDKSKIAKEYQKKLVKLCGEDVINQYVPEPPKTEEIPFKKITEWLTELARDIDKYLFVKRLWQQTLTYARYHAKALDDKKETAEKTP